MAVAPKTLPVKLPPLPLITTRITHHEISLSSNQETNHLRAVITMEALVSTVLTAWMLATEEDPDIRLTMRATNTDTAVLSPRMHRLGELLGPKGLTHLHTKADTRQVIMVITAVGWEANTIKVA
jgi:hypothetical protein